MRFGHLWWRDISLTFTSRIRLTRFDEPLECADSACFANRSSQSYFHSFRWYFGDGDSADGYHVCHQYDSSGPYAVTLVGFNDCNSRTFRTDTFIAKVPPKSGFVVDSIHYTCEKAVVHIQDTTKGSAKLITYTFGDGSPTDTARSLSHTYTKPGRYVITQTTSNAYCSRVVSDTIDINIDTVPIANFKLLVDKGCAPLSLNYQSTSLFTDSIATSFTNPLSDTGWQTIDLYALNTQGCIDTQTFKVYSSPRPSLRYTIKNIDTSCKKLSYTFAVDSNYYTTSGRWNFGNGLFSNTLTASTTYTKTQIYPIQLISSNLYCSDTLVDSILVYIEPTPQAGFQTSDTVVCVPYQLYIKNDSRGAIQKIHYTLDNQLVDTIIALKAPGTYHLVQTAEGKTGLFSL
ncbi:MAG: PKD domain-containing protein [Cytophagales bacterium]|nr:PKD domain-containing protein [Cytophagales bacterium]